MNLVLVNGDVNVHGGVIVSPPTVKMFIQGQPVAVNGSDLTPYLKGLIPCKANILAKPNAKIYVNGLAVCDQTDIDTCGSSFLSSLTNTKVFVS